MALNSGASVRRSTGSQCSSFFLEFEQDKSRRLIASLRLSSRPFDTQNSFSLAPQMKSIHLSKTCIVISGSKCIPVGVLTFHNTLETLLQSCALLYHYMSIPLCSLWGRSVLGANTGTIPKYRFLVKCGSVNVLSNKQRRRCSKGGRRDLAINPSLETHL
jgi:hypothetical protein